MARKSFHIEPKPSDRVSAKLLKLFDGQNPAELAYGKRDDYNSQMGEQRARWQEELRFLSGDQWLYHNLGSPAIYSLNDMRDKKNPKIYRCTLNKMLPAFDLKMSRIGRVKHLPEVAPQSGESTGNDMAQMCTRYLQALWYSQRRDAIHEQVKAWMWVNGMGYQRVRWDAKKQQPVREARSPFEVCLLPYGITRIEQVEQIIDLYPVSLERLKAEYPEQFTDITDYELEEEANTLLGDLSSLAVGGSRTFNGLMGLMEVHVRPNGKFPKGYRLLATNHRCLVLEELKDPDLLDECPSVPFGYMQHRYREMPGSAYPIGGARPLMPHQLAYNKIASTAIAYFESHANARQYIDDRAGINEDEFQKGNGPIHYNPTDDKAELPQWVVRPNLQTDIFNWREWLKQDFDDAAQSHASFRGEAEGARMAASAMAGLALKDEAHIGPVLDRFSQDEERLSEYDLELTRRHMKEPPVLVGVDWDTQLNWTLETFKNTDIPKRARVYVRTISESPYDKSVNREMFMALMNAGMLADFKPQELRRMVQYGVNPSMYDPDNDKRMRARAKIKSILGGNYKVGVEQWRDDPFIFAEELDKIANQPEFETLSNDAKTAIQNAVMLYRDMIQKAQEEQAKIVAAEKQPAMPQQPGMPQMPQQ